MFKRVLQPSHYTPALCLCTSALVDSLWRVRLLTKQQVQTNMDPSSFDRPLGRLWSVVFSGYTEVSE